MRKHDDFRAARIVVRVVPTSAILHDLADVEALLDDAERARAARFRVSAARQDHLAAHALRRILLGAFTGRAPASLRFGTSPSGKPILNPPIADVEFSLSHAGGRVGCGVSTIGPIGLDLEPNDAPVHAGVAAIVLAPDEITWLATQPDRRRAMLRLWVIKEAILKAAGTGLMTDPRAVVVRPGASSPLRLPTPFGVADSWQLSEFSVADHLGAVAVRATECRGRLPIGNWDIVCC